MLNNCKIAVGGEMTPERELDAWIAEHVMGIAVQRDQITRGRFAEKRSDDPWECFEGSTNDKVKPYSTDITAAWEVVEKMKSFEPVINWNDEQHCWVVGFSKAAHAMGSSQSAAYAICLAAKELMG